MDTDHLIHMANRIAEFFDAMPDRREAVAGIAQHLRKFWEPRMRAAIVACVDAGAEGLHPLAVEAVRTLAVPERP